MSSPRPICSRCLISRPCRIANLYFLSLVIIQIFPVFGAPSPQTSALPLLFILVVTAVKDAIEDYRRSMLDDEVNNSASTKLGQWKNVNQPTDPRSWFEKLLRINPPGKVTKGVRKLQVLLRVTDRVRMSFGS